MTAGVDNTEMKTSGSITIQLSTDIEEIFEFLSLNNKIIFKSQQIDDPELQRIEKVQIAKALFERNRQIFLQRFGVYFEEQHFNTFERHLAAAANCTQQESVEEIRDMLHEFRSRLQTRKRDIKNRRYTAMQGLIKEGEYFSELEMMKRAPDLYQELVGQYLSEEEIKQRDSYDVKNTTISGIFMHQLEQQQREEILQNAENKIQKERRGSENIDLKLHVENKTSKITNDFEVEVDSDDDEVDMSKQKDDANYVEEYDVPKPCRLQWGSFDSESIACSTSRVNQQIQPESKSMKKKSNIFITAGERDLLRQEFVDIMHQQFLSGEDENFDYAMVDDNTQLDDLTQVNQDKEDAYFAASDEDDEDIANHTKITANGTGTDSEDELDVYMRHLNQHHSLKY